MPIKVQNKLAQLAKAERYIAQFQKLSSIHEWFLTECNDRLDYAWKDGYEKGVLDANAAKQADSETESEKFSNCAYSSPPVKVSWIKKH
jgi:hypothetical protein